MNVFQPDNSVIRDLLYAWHKKKSIKCPTCRICVFQYDGTAYLSSVRVKYEIVLIHHSPCPSSIGNCGKGLFFCLSCGGQSSHTFGRLLDRGCKCVGVTKNKNKKSLNQQIQTNDSAASNNDDVGCLGDSNVVSDVNRKNPTEASASYSQNNPAEDHVVSNDDVGCDFNNGCESALVLCGDLAIIGDNNNTTEDSVAENNASAIGNKKNAIIDSANYSQKQEERRFHAELWERRTCRKKRAIIFAMREKELRFALICYGGISLAVYMHGITKEVWRLAAASRAVPVAAGLAPERLASLVAAGLGHMGTGPIHPHAAGRAARPPAAQRQVGNAVAAAGLQHRKAARHLHGPVGVAQGDGPAPRTTPPSAPRPAQCQQGGHGGHVVAKGAGHPGGAMPLR